MWDTTVGLKSFSYLKKINKEANAGGNTGVIQESFGNEGTGQKMQKDYPWVVGDKLNSISRIREPLYSVKGN